MILEKKVFPFLFRSTATIEVLELVILPFLCQNAVKLGIFQTLLKIIEV